MNCFIDFGVSKTALSYLEDSILSFSRYEGLEKEAVGEVIGECGKEYWLFWINNFDITNR